MQSYALSSAEDAVGQGPTSLVESSVANSWHSWLVELGVSSPLGCNANRYVALYVFIFLLSMANNYGPIILHIINFGAHVEACLVKTLLTGNTLTWMLRPSPDRHCKSKVSR